MMNSSQRITFLELNKKFKESNGKKIDSFIIINSDLLGLLKEMDLSKGSPAQKLIVELYIHILIRIEYDPHSFKTSLSRKLEYAFDTIDRHFIS
jgi:hypothetical protein